MIYEVHICVAHAELPYDGRVRVKGDIGERAAQEFARRAVKDFYPDIEIQDIEVVGIKTIKENE